jgi:hypothetical protein
MIALKLNRCRCLVHLAPLAGRGRSGPAGHDAIQLEDEKPANLSLRLELDAGNIGQLEAMPCEDIFTDLESRARATLSKIQSLQELAQTSADATNTRIYGFSRDIDRRWIHRFLQAHPMDVDTKLLHYHLGGSSRPQRLWEFGGRAKLVSEWPSAQAPASPSEASSPGFAVPAFLAGLAQSSAPT